MSNGEPERDGLRHSRVELDDVMAAARRNGVADLDAVRYAVLETDGRISIIPAARPGAGSRDQPPR